MKDILLVISVLIAIGLTVVVIGFNEKATKASKNLEEERYGRMVAEEGLQKSAAKLATLESQVKSADAKMAKIQDILDQQKGVNSDLKQQYEKLAQNKVELEAKLKTTAEEQQALLLRQQEAQQVTEKAQAAVVQAAPAAQ